MGQSPYRAFGHIPVTLRILDNPEKAQYSSLDVLTFGGGGYEYKRYAVTKDDEEKEIVQNIGHDIFNICAQKEECTILQDTAEYLMAEEPQSCLPRSEKIRTFALRYFSKQ